MAPREWHVGIKSETIGAECVEKWPSMALTSVGHASS